jgi:hypothetical protein
VALHHGFLLVLSLVNSILQLFHTHVSLAAEMCDKLEQGGRFIIRSAVLRVRSSALGWLRNMEVGLYE